MTMAEATTELAQEKMNCLASKHLHVKALSKLTKRNDRIDYLAIAVPIAFYVVRYFFKGTPLEGVAEFLWEILALILLLSVLSKMAFKWQEKAGLHSRLLGENIQLAAQADMLFKQERPPQEAMALFRSIAGRLEQDDREALRDETNEAKQFAFREGLKEFTPGDSTTTCPKCNTSPWDYKPGNCQMCGNTPVHKKGAA
jgi:mobilome CxxCx(11)CxxC protein